MKRITLIFSFFILIRMHGYAEKGLSNPISIKVKTADSSDSTKSKNISRCLSFLSNKDSASRFAYHFGVVGMPPRARLYAEYLYGNNAFNELVLVLNSENTVGKVYAAEMLLNAHINKIFKIDLITFLTIDKLFNSRGEISIGQGCVGNIVSVKKAVKIFKLNKLRRKAKRKRN